MDKQTTNWMAIACFALCALCVFVAIERYNTNADNVRAMNAMGGGHGFGQLLGSGNLKPATPAETKYAGFFAVLLAAGGVVLLLKGDGSGNRESNRGNQGE